MQKLSNSKRLTISAICAALCYALPVAFHSVNLGSVMSPMHLPVLLCGIICGPLYGLLCAIVGPILSTLLSGMPGPVMLLSMIPELITYAVMSGIFFKILRTKNLYLNLYLSLIPAMLLGRVVGGICKAAVVLSGAGEYSIALWAQAFFVTTLPGAILQLVIIPALVFTLIKTKIIPYGESHGQE